MIPDYKDAIPLEFLYEVLKLLDIDIPIFMQLLHEDHQAAIDTYQKLYRIYNTNTLLF